MENGKIVQAEPDTWIDLKWGKYPTFGDKRGDNVAEYYRDLPSIWYMPLDWVNYSESKLFTEEYGYGKRYFTMLYHALLIIGQNEFGPVNIAEMLYVTFTLLYSIILSALVFSDILVQIDMMLSKSSQNQL